MENQSKNSIQCLLPHFRKDLRSQIMRSLMWGDIKTLDDLCKKTDYELLRLPGLGTMCLKQIKKVLVEFDLELAKTPQPTKVTIPLIARWKHIETAPKDGTIILAANGEWVATMSFVPMPAWTTADGYFRFRGVTSSSMEFDLMNQPTHWVHLPKPLEPH